MPSNKRRSWFRMASLANGEAEVVIYDEIGMWGITAAAFRESLLALGSFDSLTLRINSPGGEVFAGWAIYNMLDRLDCPITVYIDGIAASMASLVAMVGDTIIMPENAMMMIHDPAGFVMGTADDMRDIADVLDRMKLSIINAYARKSGLPSDEISQIMSDETWYTAAEAVAAGFADEVEEAVRAAATFDLSRFQHPPTAMGRKPRGPRMTPTVSATAAIPPAQPQAPAPVAVAPVAPAPAPVAPAPAPVAAAETADQMRARIQGEFAARVQEIGAICELAGKPNRAAAFIAEGKTPAEVMAALQAEKSHGGGSKPAPGATITAAHQPAAGGAHGGADDDTSDLVATPDPSKIWARYNDRKAGPFSARRRA